MDASVNPSYIIAYLLRGSCDLDGLNKIVQCLTILKKANEWLLYSFVSGVALLGIPSEIYLYGTQCTASNVCNVTIMVLTGVFYLPVYFKLQLNSIFEVSHNSFEYYLNK